MDRSAYGSIHRMKMHRRSRRAVCTLVCVGTRYRIFEINIQVARRGEEKGASLDATCTRDVYTTVMRFNIDQLYMPLGFGEEAVRLYLEATGDNNEGKQVTMGLSLRAQLYGKMKRGRKRERFSRGRIKRIGNRFVRWNFYEYCY